MNIYVENKISPGRYLVLIPLTIVMIGPLIWMLRVAFAPTGASLDFPELWLSEFTFSNFYDSLTSGQLSRALFNSAFVGAAVTIGNVLFCFLSGYALARKRFPGGKLIFISMLMILMVPTHVLIIPLFLLLTKVGMFDTYWALILPFLVSPIGVFMVRQYFGGIPVSLEEAARIDGAGEIRILFTVLAPLCKPILAVLAIQTFLTNWNSFLYPFILTSSEKLQTLPVTLALMQGYQAIDWQRLMAGSTLSVIPVLIIFILFQRQIVSGITAGAVKQ
ncbi:MAG: carbohydrate ABC transporter permease [candidate division Zixibacteria bacterium]|nr:carbohydrate ABC transporter permease [candidate division Zixibacteria bacterium]